MKTPAVKSQGTMVKGNKITINLKASKMNAQVLMGD